MRSWLYALPVAAMLFASTRVDAQDTGVSGSIERLSTSTPAEKQKYAAEALDEMRASLTRMQRIEETSPECVTERLPLLSSLVAVSEIAQTNMSRWITEGNQSRADSEFRKIAIALSTARTLLAEAERCNSGDVSSGDGPIIEFRYDGIGGTGDETYQEDEFEFDVGQDPPQSSPFM